MDDGSPDNWLPEGWRVQVNVRKSGKKDKWYFPPTGGAKFYSKLEVTRYLKSNRSGINIGDNEGHTSDDSYNLNAVNNTRSNNDISTIDSSDNFGTMGNITTTTPSNTVKHSNNLDLVNIAGSNPTSTSTMGKNSNNITDSGNHFANSHPRSEEKEENGTLKRSSKQVTFEKATAEGLPPGWTKDVKVTKKGSKIRRDPYYTDPEKEYTFRSMKDAVRYIQTGEIGRLAIRRWEAKLREYAEAGETLSPASAKRQKLGTDTTMNGSNQSLKVPEVKPTGNNQTFKVTEVAQPAPEACPDVQAMQHEEMDLTLKATELATAIASEMLPQKHTVQHKVKEIEATPPEAKAVSDMQPVQHKVENHEAKNHTTTGKSKKKKDVVQHPRRASKRFAALPLEPTTSEPEASPSSHQAAAAAKTVDVTTVSLDSASALKTPSQHRHVAALVKPSSELTDPKLEINHVYQNTCEARKVSPESNMSKLSGTCKRAEEGEAGKLPLDAPLEELWEDPCIAFAIKTLTGSLDDLPLGSNNNGFGDSASFKEHVATPEVSFPEMEPINNSQNPGSPVSLSAAYTWGDPCIEFAIKTLTGAIPLESDLFNMQEQPTSSQQVQPNSGQVFHQSTTLFPTEAAARVEQLSLPQTKIARYTGGSSPSAGMGRRVTRSQRKAV